MTTDTYEERIIAYADILGWREASKNPSEFGRLKAAAQGIADHARLVSKAPADIEFSFFSDSFAVSAPVNSGQNVFRIMSWASNSLLHENKFLVRGGVTIGYLYHKQNIIFGPAMIEAVEIEEMACYPRLLCSEKLGRYLEQTNYKNTAVIKDDSDQNLVVNIAVGNKLIVKEEIMTIIEGELSKAVKFAHKSKWQYLQEMLPKMYEALDI